MNSPMYQWLFDGVGGAVVVALGAWILRRAFKSADVPVTTVRVRASENASLVGSPVATGSNITQVVNLGLASPPNDELAHYSPTPRPSDIKQRLRAMTPYERHLVSASSSYQGHRVAWPVEFLGVSIPKDSETCRASFYYRADNDKPWDYVIVFADVDLSKYPRLKSVFEGEQLSLAGTIESVDLDGNQITLKDVRITFSGNAADGSA